jgi:hypothetical protein
MELLGPFKLKIVRLIRARVRSKRISGNSAQLSGEKESNFDKGLNCNSNTVLSSVDQICQFSV